MAVKQKLTVREAADLHGVFPSAIYAAIKRGDLTPDRRGKLVMIKRADLMAYRKRQRDALRPKDPTKMTDAEFMQMLLDDDPDDG